MKKNTNYILIIVITALLLFLTVASIIKPDVRMSENENRILTQAPEFRISDILDGRFESQLEDYLSDQIIGRENWIRITAGTMKAAGARDANGVYFLDGGRLAERLITADFNDRRFRANVDEVMRLRDDLMESDIPVDLMLVPTAVHSYSEEYNMSTNFNENAAMGIASHQLEGSFIDLRDELSADKGDFYFMTDHHWNYDGAMKSASVYITDALGRKAPEYIEHELTSDFRGTLYSKVLLNEDVTDSIRVPEGSLDKKVKVVIDGDEYDSVYFMDRLENKDKYEVFFGGNYGRVDIDTGSQNVKGERLLIVKDSYANSFVPFILDEFGSITMVDTRYFKESVKDLAEKEGFTRVLVLYSISNFSQGKMALSTDLLQ